jgi:hypothetical protein
MFTNRSLHMIISNAKLILKKSLIGSFDLEMPSGFIVRGAMLLESSGKRWVNFPSKEYQKQDGNKGYFPLLEFASREISDRFQAKVLPLVNEAFKNIEPVQEPARRAGQTTAQFIDDDICF